MSVKTIPDLLAALHGEAALLSPSQEKRLKTVKRLDFAVPYNGKEPELSREQVIDIGWGLIAARVHSIAHSVQHTLLRNRGAVGNAVMMVANWIKEDATVRILGAGRALLAGGMPGNRLAHAGPKVSFMGGMVPLPNSIAGGGIVACSASGETGVILDAMATAKKLNPAIEILGLAYHKAIDFSRLCDVFIGLHLPKTEYPNPLSALADTEEYMISEILDGIVVMAGKVVGFDDQAWRRGHEDIGPTGPYAPGRSRK